MPTFFDSKLVTEKKTTLVEQTFTEPTFFRGYIDLAPMKKGDKIRITMHIKIKPRGRWRRWGNETYSDKQTCPALRIRGGPTGFAFRLSMKKLKGQNRSFDWMITCRED